MRKHLPFVFGLLVFSVVSLFPIFRSGMMQTHDGLWHVQRSVEMLDMLRRGQFPVRWAANLDNGYGIPLFNFIYPLPYYLAAGLMSFHLSSITTLKLLTFAAYFLGGVGVYLLFAKQRFLAFCTAVIYLLTPYLLVDIFVRGEIGEVMAIATVPYVLLLIQKLRETGKFLWYVPLPLAIALLSHNFLGAILAFAALIYLFVYPGKHLKAALLSWFLSLGLSTFFILPMALESRYLLSYALHNYSFNWQDHFVYPWQFLNSKWGYGFSMPGVAQDGFTFQLGFANLTALLIFLFWGRKVGRQYLLWLLAAGLTIFLMLPYSSWLWRLIPFIQLMQFPWRLLAVMIMVTTMMVGLSLTFFHQAHPKLSIWLGVSIVMLAIFNTWTFHAPSRNLPAAEFMSEYHTYLNRTTTAMREEVVPKWALQPRWQPQSSRLASAYLGMLDGNGSLNNVVDNSQNLTFTANAEAGTKAVYYRNYFPSWHGSVDSQALSLSPSATGEIIVPLTAGQHTYHLWVGSTAIEELGNAVTLLSIICLTALGIYGKTRKTSI